MKKILTLIVVSALALSTVAFAQDKMAKMDHKKPMMGKMSHKKHGMMAKKGAMKKKGGMMAKKKA